MTRRELLDKAAEKTCTNREDTFPQIAHFWGCEPLEVCIDMILLEQMQIVLALNHAIGVQHETN